VESKEGRRWIVDAFVFFLPVLFLWIIATIWVSSSLGADIQFLAGLRTSLLADYSPDIFNQSFKSMKLAILGDVFSDTEFPSDSMTGLDLALHGLVPTATLRTGSFESTVTPEFTPTYESQDDTASKETPVPSSTPNKNPGLTATPVQISTATPTPSHTPTPTNVIPTATAMRENVTPLLECVLDNNDGTLTAFFGYMNPNSFHVEIPIGDQNRFTPGSEDQGQPTIFEPGQSPAYPNASFQVDFEAESITWILDTGSVTASAHSNDCDPIVPQETKDTEPPNLSGGDIDPSPRDLEVCSLTITVDNLRVVDPPISSGIEWVKLKYNVEGYTTDYIYSNPMTLCSGGWTDEGGWHGCYGGSIVVNIDPTWIPPDSSTPFKINLFAKARDNEGRETCYPLGQYTMPACCGACE
jgi:hypothetical protein